MNRDRTAEHHSHLIMNYGKTFDRSTAQAGRDFDDDFESYKFNRSTSKAPTETPTQEYDTAQDDEVLEDEESSQLAVEEAQETELNAALPQPEPAADRRTGSPEKEYLFLNETLKRKRVFPKTYFKANLKGAFVQESEALAGVNSALGTDLDKSNFKFQWNLATRELTTKIGNETKDVVDWGPFKLSLNWSAGAIKENGLELSPIGVSVAGKFNKDTLANSPGWVKDLYQQMTAQNPAYSAMLEQGWAVKLQLTGTMFVDPLDFERMKDLKDIRKQLDGAREEVDKAEKTKKKADKDYKKERKKYIEERKKEYKKNTGKKRVPNRQLNKYKDQFNSSEKGQKLLKDRLKAREGLKKLRNKVDELVRRSSKIARKMSSKFGRTFGKNAARTIRVLGGQILKRIFILLAIIDGIIAVIKIIKFWDHLSFVWSEEDGKSLDEVSVSDEVPEAQEEPTELEKQMQEYLKEEGHELVEGESDGSDPLEPGSTEGNRSENSNAGGGAGAGANSNGSDAGAGSGSASTPQNEEDNKEEVPQDDYPVVTEQGYGEPLKIDPMTISDEALREEFQYLEPAEQALFNLLHDVTPDKEGEGSRFSEEELRAFIQLLDDYYEYNNEQNFSLDKLYYVTLRLERGTGKGVTGMAALELLRKVLLEKAVNVSPHKTHGTTPPGGDGKGPDDPNGVQVEEEKKSNVEDFIPFNPATTKDEEERGKGNMDFEPVTDVVEPDVVTKTSGISTSDFSYNTMVIVGKPSLEKARVQDKGVPCQLFLYHKPSGKKMMIYPVMIYYASLTEKGNYNFKLVNSIKIKFSEENGKVYSYTLSAERTNFYLKPEQFKHQVKQ